MRATWVVWLSVAGTIGDLYLTIADHALGPGLGKFPTAGRKLGEALV